MTSKPIVGQINYQDEFYKAAIFPSDDGNFSVCIMECDRAFERDLVGTHIENFPEDDIYFKMKKKRKLSSEEFDKSPSFNLTDKRTLNRLELEDEDTSPSLNLTSKRTEKRFRPDPIDLPKVYLNSNSNSETSTFDLRPGWTQQVDENGRIFYMNKYLGITQWQPPMGSPVPDPKLPAAPPSYKETSAMIKRQMPKKADTLKIPAHGSPKAKRMPKKADSLKIPVHDSPRVKRQRKKDLLIASTPSYPDLPSNLCPPVNFPGFLKFDNEIGIEFSLYQNGFVVTSVQPCSPAFHECIKQGLQLESIYDGNCKPIQAMSARQLKQQLDLAPRPLYIKFTSQRLEAVEQVYAEVPYHTYRQSYNVRADDIVAGGAAKSYQKLRGRQSNQGRARPDQGRLVD